MTAYDNWVAKASYKPADLAGRLTATPFVNIGGKCILQCQPQYSVDNISCNGAYYDSSGNSVCTNEAHDPIRQRCMYDNCKNYDSAKTAKHCSACFDQNNMKFYQNWKGRASYKEQAVIGRTLATPWGHDSTREQCTLQCDSADYWHDWRYWDTDATFIPDSELTALSVDPQAYAVSFADTDPVIWSGQDHSGTAENDAFLAITITHSTIQVKIVGWNKDVYGVEHT
jgi:hypothetical protein